MIRLRLYIATAGVIPADGYMHGGVYAMHIATAGVIPADGYI